MDVSKNLIRAMASPLKKCTVLLTACVMASSSVAMTSFTFKATVNDSSAFNGTTGFGTVTYDEGMMGSGNSYLYTTDNTISQFDIAFTMFDQTFGRDNDIDDLLELEMYTEPTDSWISFVVSEIDVPDPIIDGGSDGFNYTAINNPQILAISLYNSGAFRLAPAGSDWDYDIDVELITTEVPIPASAWLFVTALTGLAGISSRRRKHTA